MSEMTYDTLDHIASVLGLSDTELAGLFGVRRLALDQWRAGRVPPKPQEKLATLSEITDLLSAKLKSDAIPGVVRQRAPAYGGRSILVAVAAGDEELVLS